MTGGDEAPGSQRDAGRDFTDPQVTTATRRFGFGDHGTHKVPVLQEEVSRRVVFMAVIGPIWVRRSRSVMRDWIAEPGAWAIALIMIVVASWVFYRYFAPHSWREWAGAGLV